MLSFIISGIITFLLIVFTIYWVIKTVKKKLEGNKINILPFFGLTICTLIAGVFCIYSILSFLNDNRGKIANMGQEAISNTVEYTSVAVLEGLGKTVDHFENKWDKKRLDALGNLKVSINKFDSTRLSETIVKIEMEVEIENNELDQDFYLKDIETDNYLLIGDSKDLVYVLKFKEAKGKLIKGKSNHLVTVLVDPGYKPVYIRLGDSIVEI